MEHQIKVVKVDFNEKFGQYVIGNNVPTIAILVDEEESAIILEDGTVLEYNGSWMDDSHDTDLFSNKDESIVYVRLYKE
jgi:hypothetical protein